MTSIPIALPLERCQPGAIHRNNLGQAWFGHEQRINPDTGMFQEATLTLTTEPREGDSLWIDAHAISLPGAGPTEWPTLDQLEQGIQTCRRALAEHPDDAAWRAQADARLAIQKAADALSHARIMVAEAEAAVARELAAAADNGEDQLLTPAGRNTSMMRR